ncbi:hypothetical protein [Pseudomonas sp. MWU13-2100]|uniref:hypothetical protein n=1 Tax=Pseudomonas sp. MWU13-2100 TaxID=2935075 RepID=UPI00200E6D58|nr:hypothetical protein [Pseudomonas sp. MWU13-2100]
MQTNRTDFDAGFALLGLNTSPGAQQLGAVPYARQFKKCTILTEVNVSYSASTSVNSSVKLSTRK